MHARSHPGFGLPALVLFLAVVAPVHAGPPINLREPIPVVSPAACDHPCTHVDDCPKVTCQCESAAGTGVAACDTKDTHCCVSAETACGRFCEIHGQKWVGRFTAETGTTGESESGSSGASAGTTGNTSASTTGTRAGTAPSACAESCQKAEDCRPTTCQCAHGIAENVSACDPKAHCCGDARIVCGHYCVGKKGAWTGKTAAAVPPSADTKSLLGAPADDGLYGDDEQPH